MIALNIVGGTSVTEFGNTRSYRSNIIKYQGTPWDDLLNTTFNYYLNFLKILEHINAGHAIQSVACIGEPWEFTPCEVQPNIILLDYHYDYPRCLQPSYKSFQTTVGTGFALSCLWQSNFLEDTLHMEGDFSERIGEWGQVDKFVFYNWCSNRRVRLCQK